MLVVVHPSYRGMGLGKLLMDACEQLAIRLKFLSAVLSTHDKQGFYEKLGYVLCDPVSLHGAPLPIKNTFVSIALFNDYCLQEDSFKTNLP